MTEEQSHRTARLVGAAQGGDEQAREALFALYLPRVARMVAARMGVARRALSADCEDLAQEALLRAFAGLDRFEMRTPGAFAHWLETIVLNCVRQRHRRNSRAPERVLWQRYGDIDLSASFFDSGAPTPSRILGGKERDDQVERALLDLPELYRRALVARFIGELGYDELAEHLQRNPDNCRKIVQRGLALLRARCGVR